MRNSIRQVMIATTAIIGLSTFAAAAPPPGTGNPIVGHATGSTAPMEVTVEQQITDLHAKLQISAAQKSQWDQFAGVMRDNAKTMDQTFQTRAQAMPTMTAADNMKSYADIAAQHSQDMAKLVPAFQSLYASMSDAQKRTADQVFRADAAQGKQANKS